MAEVLEAFRAVDLAAPGDNCRFGDCRMTIEQQRVAMTDVSRRPLFVMGPWLRIPAPALHTPSPRRS
jgi:hypothetical protein